MKTLTREQFFTFIDSVIKEYEFYAPKKNSDNRVNFEKIGKAKDIYFDYVVTDDNPSNFMFPKRETLFKFNKDKNKVVLEEVQTKLEKQRIIFGARPCDAAALRKFDKLFNADNMKDAYYNDKRQASLIFGVACNKAAGSCFCTSVNVSPHQKDNMDVMVYILNDGKKYLVDVLSKKAKDISKLLSGKESSEQELEEQKKLQKEAISSIKNKFDENELKDKLDKGFYNTEFWMQETNKCIRCGICAMVCPSCYCFDISDEKNERCRFWDACTLKMFTKQASGFNPRSDKFRGYRQRFYHKFNFFNKKFEEALCVGCGRCIIHCPTKVDILEIALKVPDKTPEKKDDKSHVNDIRVC